MKKKLFSNNEWAQKSSEIIRQEIEKVIKEKGKCYVMLTGGNSAKEIYKIWGSQIDFPNEKITYFWGDERCVPQNHSESNFGSSVSLLFPRGIPRNISLHYIDANADDKELAAINYESLLPNKIDILLLGLGEDGHIASIFPFSEIRADNQRRIVFVTGPKSPFERLTITPRVIKEARSIFLLVKGEQKGEVLAKAISGGTSELEFPVKYALESSWLLDSAAREKFEMEIK